MVNRVNRVALQAESDPGKGQGGFRKYYRLPNGEIGLGPARDDLQELRLMKEGWQPLDRYGAFDFNDRSNGHEFDVLFDRGGAKELGLAQLIETGWAYTGYRLRDGRHVEFAQLQGVELPPRMRCYWCEREGQQAAIAQHMGVAHREEAGPAKIAQAIAASMAGKPFDPRPTAVGPSPKEEAPEKIVELRDGGADRPPPASGDYICGRCFELFRSPFQLTRHVKAMHAAPAAAGVEPSKEEVLA